MHPGSVLRLLCIALVLLGGVASASAESADNWTFAYRPGCGDCDRALPLVQAYQAAHPEQPIDLLELSSDPATTARFNALVELYGARAGVPVLFAGGHAVSGLERIRAFLADPVAVPTTLSASSTSAGLSPLTPAIVATAGLVDGINPCAFAVLALLLGTLSMTGTRRRAVILGGAYTAGLFLCYLGAGLGIVTLVGITGIASAFRIGAGVVALLLGIVVLLSVVLPDGPFRFAIPDAGRRAASRWIASLQTAGPVAAFLLGIALGLVELPCTGGVYLGVLGLLAGGSLSAAFPLLVLYNLCFVAPLVLIVGAFAAGMGPGRIDSWREERRRIVLGVSGAVMLGLGLVLLGKELL